MLEAKEKAGIYQMRFAGLFDCAIYEAHGLGLLIYDNLINNQVSTYKNYKLINVLSYVNTHVYFHRKLPR